MIRVGIVAALALGALLAVAPAVAETPGQYHQPFASSGRTTINIDLIADGHDLPLAMATTADDGIVLVGSAQFQAGATPPPGLDYDQGVVVLDSTGTPDAGFDDNGKMSVAIDLGGTNYDEATAVAVDSQGRVALAGLAKDVSDWKITVTRLTSGGDFDNSFSGEGLYQRSDGDSDAAPRLGVDGSDRIVVGTTVDYDEDPADNFAMVYRFEASSLNGAELDPTFSTDGIASWYLHDLGDVLVAPDDRIVVALTSQLTGITVVLRLEADGDPDPTWGGGDGAMELELGTVAQANVVVDAAFDPNGGVVILGYALDGPTKVWKVARVHADGTQDFDFGSAGTAALAGLIGFPTAVATQSDGAVLVGGLTGNPTILRLTRAGVPDVDFGSTPDGVASFTYETSDAEGLSAIALAGDGRILACGASLTESDPTWDFGIAKLQNDVVFHDGFEWQGLFGESRWSSTVP